MRPLSAQTIIRLWEWGQGRNLADRALGLLNVALPDRSQDELASLSLGRRDALLLGLREETFGPTLDSYGQCPECGQGLEFTLRVSDLVVSPDDSESDWERKEFELASGDYALRFRLPDTADLSRLAACIDANEARGLLAERCVLQATRAGREAPLRELPDEVMRSLSARMIECDPQAEVLLDLDCPACGHSWLAVFEIASFFWNEVSAQAVRLLREVDALARAYGWSEADILSMTAARRQLYLEMVT